jgi:hypothetical protein
MCELWIVKLVNKLHSATGLLLLFLVLNGCARKYHMAASPVSTEKKIPDYSKTSYWAALPGLQDPSDSIPLPLRDVYTRDTSIDVFFVHPTSYTLHEAVEWNADADDVEINAKTDRTSILYQASVFNRYNVYAPRYRQAHIQAYFTTDTVLAKQAFDLAYSDVRRAFDYYLQHYNNGKPVIIASHSQGTTHAKRLLRELFDKTPLKDKLVVAYLIGINVEPDYFPTLQPCKDSLQTGCFVGWRTFRRGFEPDYGPSARTSVVVNPLSWTLDTSYVPERYHRGAILRNFNEIAPEVNDAVVYKDLLWISRPRFPGSKFYRARNYHIGDINLFYINIRENLDQRVRAYLKTKSHEEAFLRP